MAQVFDHRKATPVIPLEPGLPTFGRMDLCDGGADVRTGRHVYQLREETLYDFPRVQMEEIFPEFQEEAVALTRT